MDLLYVFDYDDTIVTSSKTPNEKKFVKVSNAIKNINGYPMIIFTAGLLSYAYNSNTYADRPIEFLERCGLTYSVNVFNPDVDICLFGPLKYSDISKYQSQNPNIKYVSIDEYNDNDFYQPNLKRKGVLYPLIETNRHKNLSILHRLLIDEIGCDKKINIVFVDDKKYHSLKSFGDATYENSDIFYFVIHPIKCADENISGLLDAAINNEIDKFYYKRMSSLKSRLSSRKSL